MVHGGWGVPAVLGGTSVPLCGERGPRPHIGTFAPVLSYVAACFSYLLIHAEYRHVAISSSGSRNTNQGSIVNCHIVCASHAMRMEGRETAANLAATRPILPGI